MIRKYPEADLKHYSDLTYEKSAILALLLSMLLFLVIKGTAEIKIETTEQEKIVTFDIPPEIQQQQQIKAPPRPSIPIETESDEVPEDVTIADTVIDTVWTPPPEPEAPVYFVSYDESPQIKKKVDPKYPSLARKAGIEGTVRVLVGIDEEGKVIEAKVISSVPGLDEAAVDCVKKWLFKPAMQRDRPVRVQIAVPVTFRLR
jgi:protein TonB